MFLEDLMSTKEGAKISKLSRESTTYNAYYVFWRDMLFERIMRLFVWENTDNVPPKEIEQRLLLAGHCGITKYKGELTAMYGSFYGVTKYNDEWENYNVRCPIYSAGKKIGKDVIVIDNNSLRNSTYALVHHYATELAHTEVTLINVMVNARDNGGVPIAPTEKHKRSIKDYQARIYNGQYDVVTDIGNLGIEYVGSDRKSSQSINDIMVVREKLIKSFYSDIGVRSAFEKRGNTVEAEVEADTSLLLLNLSDMLKKRQEGVEKVNKLYGTNWTVHIAEEIDYSSENERVQFDTNSEVHIKEMEEENV